MKSIFSLTILIIVGVLFLTFSATNSFAQVPPPDGGGDGGNPPPCPGCPIPTPPPIKCEIGEGEAIQEVLAGTNNVIHARLRITVPTTSPSDIRIDRIIMTTNSSGPESLGLRMLDSVNNVMWYSLDDGINLSITKGTTVELQIIADVPYKVGHYNLITQTIIVTDLTTGIRYNANGLPLVHHYISIILPPAVNPVTYGDFAKMIDTLFCINKMNLPEYEVPNTLTTPAYRHLQAIGGISWWSDEQQYNYNMYGWYLRDVLLSLFKKDQCNNYNNEMDETRWLLREYGVNLDSAEATARNLPWESFNITENDQLSSSTIAYFAQAAQQRPILVLNGAAGTYGDTTESNLTIYRNPYNLAAYQVDLSDNTYHDQQWMMDIEGHNGFSARKGTNRFYCTNNIRVGGMNSSGFNSSDFKLATIGIVSYNSTSDIYLTDAVLADVAGDDDFTAWTPKTRLYFYSRLDVNMNYNHTIADAVKLNNAYILPDSTPPVKNLGDGDYDGDTDGDDVTNIYEGAISGFGKTGLKQIQSNNPAEGTVLITPITMKGKTKLSFSFTGNYGSAQRFTGKLHFNPRLTVESVTYPGSIIEELANYYTTDGLVSFARYDSIMANEATLVEIVMLGSVDNLQLSLENLKGSYFTTTENINVEVSGVTGVGDDVTSTPKQFALQQNFPNPFNPTTTIRYSLPIATSVTLRVYNMLGQEVATLLNGVQQEAGERSVDFNASDLPSGVYVYRLQAGEFVQNERMILQK